jgi:hypothetical protein
MRIACKDILKLTEGCEYLDFDVAPAWQPIETAPKDGDSILCVDCLCRVVLWWDDSIGQWRDISGDTYEPSHWMPLPNLPVALKEAE